MHKVRELASQEELKRFFVVAKQFQQETGQQAFMPACPVDETWHCLLEFPEKYNRFCRQAVGSDVIHQPAKGHGKIGWTGVYERFYGPLPEVWFQNSGGILNKEQRREYLDTGVFRASWDCTPYVLVA